MSLNLGIISSSRNSAPSVSLLLDTYPGAAAAYSLRKLRTAYTGAAIRVRRSSDNTETDIGFVANELDTTALTTFVGANNGFVTKWYDQSGNVKDATQTTALNQPRIVLAGVIDTQLSKPSIQFLETGGNGFFTSVSIVNPFSIIGIMSQDLTTLQAKRILNSSTSNSLIAIKRLDNSIVVFTNGSTVLSSFPSQISNQTYLISFLRQTTSNFVYQNNSSVTVTSTNSSDWGTLGIGGGVGVFNEAALSKISELIIYASNKNSVITGIHGNINSYYSIYWQGTGNALLDIYPSAAAAYSLRNLSSTYLGPLVRVRRSSDNTEQDIYGTYAGVLDTATLLSFCGAGNGFISIWYDQSGKGFNATQSTTANQPQIVSSGVIILNNSKPSVQFNGTSQVMSQAVNFTGGNYYTFTSALSANVQTGYRGIFAIQFASSFGFTAYSNLSTANKWGGYQVYTTPNEQPANSSFQGAGMTLIGMRGFANQEANSSLFYKNNLSDGTYNNSVGQTGHIGGLASASQHFSGKISEIVVWNYLVVGSAPNISGINSNMNSYYTIY